MRLLRKTPCRRSTANTGRSCRRWASCIWRDRICPFAALPYLAKKQVSYGAVLVTGFYAAIPAMYAAYLMGRIDADVFLLYSLLLLIIWTVGLVAAVGTGRAGDWLREERTLCAWRTVIGILMLVIFGLDVLYE